MNKRQYHLSFCKVCQNRKYNLKYGLVCSNTNQIADFDESCSSFKLDEPELKKLKSSFQSKIEDEYAMNMVESIFSDYSYDKPNELKITNYKSAEETHNLKFRQDNIYDKYLSFMTFIFGIVLLALNFNAILKSTIENGTIIGICAIFSIAIFMFYRGFYHEYKTSISINKEGIDYKEGKLFWNNILDFGIVRTIGGSFNQNKIIIGTITKGIVEINLETLNVTPEELIEIIQLNKNKFDNTMYN